MQAFGVAGAQYHNYYSFYIGFPIGVAVPVAGGAAALQRFQGRIDIFLNLIQGIELALGSGSFEVLLGMDIIRRGSLAVEGSGTFSFSF